MFCVVCYCSPEGRDGREEGVSSEHRHTHTEMFFRILSVKKETETGGEMLVENERDSAS